MFDAKRLERLRMAEKEATRSTSPTAIASFSSRRYRSADRRTYLHPKHMSQNIVFIVDLSFFYRLRYGFSHMYRLIFLIALGFFMPCLFSNDLCSIDHANLRIFTALQSQNQISGVLNLNGNTFVPGTLFVDTATEHWCQYFAFPFPYPLSNLGNAPLFTIFYKPCLQQITFQAQIIVAQFLAVDLHPYNEYPGWMERFFVTYQKPESNQLSSTSSLAELKDEAYYLRRRHLTVVNQPKAYTILTE